MSSIYERVGKEIEAKLLECIRKTLGEPESHDEQADPRTLPVPGRGSHPSR